MALFMRYGLIFIIGSIGYSIIEILWRGYTHPTMAVLGGISLIMIYLINRRFCRKNRMLRALLSALAITDAELLSGILINVFFGLGVWDYSNQPLNFLGQICPLFSFFWFLLSFLVIIFLDKFFPAENF